MRNNTLSLEQLLHYQTFPPVQIWQISLFNDLVWLFLWLDKSVMLQNFTICETLQILHYKVSLLFQFLYLFPREWVTAAILLSLVSCCQAIDFDRLLQENLWRRGNRSSTPSPVLSTSSTTTTTTTSTTATTTTTTSPLMTILTSKVVGFY